MIMEAEIEKTTGIIIPPLTAPERSFGTGVAKTIAGYDIPRSLSEYTENDSGRAELFVDTYQLKIRYVPAWGCWLLWEGHRWMRDETNYITNLAVEHHRGLQSKIIDEVSDFKERNRMLSQTLKWGDIKRIRDMLAIASSDPRIVVDYRKLDANPSLLGVKNGVWDFEKGEMRAGSPSDLITRQALCKYNPDAECPMWESHIKFAAQGDPQMMVFLQRIAGYSFTGYTSEEVWFFHHGSGKNGKSVFCDTLRLLCHDYAIKVNSSLYTRDKFNKLPEDQLASLEGRRLACGPEVDEGERLAEARIKELCTTNATINGRLQYARQNAFQLTAKLWIYGNHYPDIRGTDDGVWRRLRLIPWTAQVESGQVDKNFSQKLIEREGEGILRWVLLGAQEWKRRGDLGTPSSVAAASAEYRLQEDVLVDYVEGELCLDASLWCSRQALWEHYSAWTLRAGINRIGVKKFYERIRQLSGVSDPKRNGQRGFSGVSFTS